MNVCPVEQAFFIAEMFRKPFPSIVRIVYDIHIVILTQVIR
ncbi:hypothetical protein B4122_1681 [Bacillus subtilis]|uniref:Uncharacterized protein n=1 Tax=Bacillus subtilis TaxID=1423 RepID=A0AAP1H9P8_BACIU|nr:hypothetical protein B4122_1681 [Bacillus subtilis]